MSLDDFTGERTYRVGNRLRVHGWNDEGKYRILRWEDVDPERIEYTIGFGYTGTKGNRSMKWEVRITGDADLTYEDAVEWGEALFASEGFPWEYIAELRHNKIGVDDVDDKREGVYGKAISGSYIYPAYGEKRLDDIYSE